VTAHLQATKRSTKDVAFPGVTWSFHWSFHPSGRGATRITQRLSLSGPRAAEHIALAEADFVPGIPEGMKTLAQAMERQRSHRSGEASGKGGQHVL